MRKYFKFNNPVDNHGDEFVKLSPNVMIMKDGNPIYYNLDVHKSSDYKIGYIESDTHSEADIDEIITNTRIIEEAQTAENVKTCIETDTGRTDITIEEDKVIIP